VSLVTESGTLQHKVMVAVPSGTMVHASFAQDLALLMGYTTYVRPDVEVSLAFVKGTYLPRARASLVQYAEERLSTHILWLDADMRFPKDTLLRLIDHKVSIVAANYPTRQPPILPTAVDVDRNLVFAVEGLQEVERCGMGVMLTDMAVFRAIGKPYFALGYSRADDDYSGEDTFFCERARKEGFPIFIDGPLSEAVSHLGEFSYGMPHARMTQEAAHGADKQD